MASLATKNFDTPDETRAPAKTRVDVLDLGDGVKAARLTFQPGWRWSECVKPAAGTDTCQTRHVGAVVSGQLHITHTDGGEITVGPGDAYLIGPGHDAWVVGDTPFVAYEFESTTAGTYAKPAS
jgi:mannose-6-phosphate isomerase-like protein (cupin superfamily)